jgi:hypothetical protein
LPVGLRRADESITSRSLDLLVNNAGIALPGDTPETIAIVVQTNLHGPVIKIGFDAPLKLLKPGTSLLR